MWQWARGAGGRVCTRGVACAVLASKNALRHLFSNIVEVMLHQSEVRIAVKVELTLKSNCICRVNPKSSRTKCLQIFCVFAFINFIIIYSAHCTALHLCQKCFYLCSYQKVYQIFSSVFSIYLYMYVYIYFIFYIDFMNFCFFVFFL